MFLVLCNKNCKYIKFVLKIIICFEKFKLKKQFLIYFYKKKTIFNNSLQTDFNKKASTTSIQPKILKTKSKNIFTQIEIQE